MRRHEDRLCTHQHHSAGRWTRCPIGSVRREGVADNDIYQEKVSSVEPRAQLDAAIRGAQGRRARRHQARPARRLPRECRLPRQQDRREGRVAEGFDPALDTSTPTGRLLSGMVAPSPSSTRDHARTVVKASPRPPQRASTRDGRQPPAPRPMMFCIARERCRGCRNCQAPGHCPGVGLPDIRKSRMTSALITGTHRRRISRGEPPAFPIG